MNTRILIWTLKINLFMMKIVSKGMEVRKAYIWRAMGLRRTAINHIDRAIAKLQAKKAALQEELDELTALYIR